MAKTVVLPRKPLSLSERTYLPQIVTGLKPLFQTCLKRRLLLQYPEEKPIIPRITEVFPPWLKIPTVARNVYLASLCEFVCPPKAIRITPVLCRRTMILVLMLKKPLRNLK